MRKLALVLTILYFFQEKGGYSGGYQLVPRSATALGRGGAFVAGAYNLNAVSFNPGRLSLLDGLNILVDLAIIYYELSFERERDPLIAPLGFPTVHNIPKWNFTPSLFIGYDFGLKDLYFSYAIYGPYAGDIGFNSMGPQRYTVIYLDMWEAINQFSVSWKPLKWLGIGGGFRLIDARMAQGLKVSSYTGVEGLGAREDPEYDILVELDVSNHFVPSGILGLWIRPLPWLEIGLSFELPAHISADGGLKTKLPSGNPLLKDAYVEGDKITIVMDLPFIINGGVLFRPKHYLEIELGFSWEKWSDHRSIIAKTPGLIIRNIEGGIDIKVEEFEILQRWEDSFSIRLGVEGEVIKEILRLRSGIFFDKSAIPDTTISVNWYDSDKIGVCFGAGIKLWKFTIDLAYAHIFFFSREIKSSIVTQINPIKPDDPELLSVVGNGKYKANKDILALSLNFNY